MCCTEICVILTLALCSETRAVLKHVLWLEGPDARCTAGTQHSVLSTLHSATELN